MSTREIYDIVYKPAVFFFEGGTQKEGMIIPRYNIRLAKIEYYFIPASKIDDYQKAKENFDREAPRYYGSLVDEHIISSSLG